MGIAENIMKLREQHNLTQAEFGEIAGVTDRAVSAWEKGIAEPRMGAIQKLADYFKITKSSIIEDGGISSASPNRITVYGSVPAGIPLEAIEDIVDWEDIPIEWIAGGNEYIGLKVKGDSMSPKYIDGDTVIIKLQPDCESGQDAVVYVNGYDATLKKIIKKPDCILLQPLNPVYDPKIYDYNDEFNPVKILGVVVELRRKI